MFSLRMELALLFSYKENFVLPRFSEIRICNFYIPVLPLLYEDKTKPLQ